MEKKAPYRPKSIFLEAFPGVSGNTVNGLGETQVRRASPFFWHPPDRQSHGELQYSVLTYHQRSPEMRENFSAAPPGGRGPQIIEQRSVAVKKTAEQWREEVKSFSLAHEADLVGIAAMDPLCVYEGYDIKEPWVILIGVSMDYDSLSLAPASMEDPEAAVEVARQYHRAARACNELTNFILDKGYYAKAYQGPFASALNMIPAALAAGMGELGKHGSIINDQYGSNFRLSAVTTDMPLLADHSVDIGVEDFCAGCQVCTNACPPEAISNEKQMVRGVEKWYVDFDKCIPYFGETLGCGICIVRCPWAYPDRAPRLVEKMLKRRKRKKSVEPREVKTKN